jgi:multidrug resistance efflux pump
MSTTEDYTRLEKRVSALERASVNNTETLKWMAGTLGSMKAVQDDHTQRLDRLETDVSILKSDVATLKADMREVKADLKGLRADLPGIVAEALRGVLKDR